MFFFFSSRENIDMDFFYIVLFNVVAVIFISPGTCKSSTFRAAVYEHAVILPQNRLTAVSRSTALKEMMKNLEIYKNAVDEAGRQNVDILVFPEDGIYGMGMSRIAMRPYLEDIPNPLIVSWNPCMEPQGYPDTDVQQILSCFARNNSIYLVANMGDIKPCNVSVDSACPNDGHFQYNTDVVYNPDGLFIARYHKINLFYEFQFDNPKVLDRTTFQTPFGTFGVFTCFDIIFRTPAIDVIEKKGARNIVFPTAWMDAQPLLTSVQFHSAFAAGTGVNFLAANIHRPSNRFHGSGIYTPNGALSFYHNTVSSEGKLLISDVPVLDSFHAANVTRSRTKVYNTTNLQRADTNRNEFNAVVFGDVFNFILLSENQGHVNVCHKKLCCQMTYNSSLSDNEYYAFGAFDGLHTYQGKYYIQVCALLKCKSKHHSSCGEGSVEAKTHFTYLKISGNFNTVYTFPEILLYQNNSIGLAKSGWRYKNGEMLIHNGLSDPLISAALFSRDYNLDNTRNCSVNESIRHIHTSPGSSNSAVMTLLSAMLNVVSLLSTSLVFYFF